MTNVAQRPAPASLFSGKPLRAPAPGAIPFRRTVDACCTPVCSDAGMLSPLRHAAVETLAAGPGDRIGMDPVDLSARVLGDQISGAVDMAALGMTNDEAVRSGGSIPPADAITGRMPRPAGDAMRCA